MGPGLGLQEGLLLPASECHPFSPIPPHRWAEGGLFLLHCGFGVHSLPFPLLPAQGQVPPIPPSPSLPSSSSVLWSLSLSQILSTPFRYRPDPLQHTLSLPIFFFPFPPLYGCSSGTAATDFIPSPPSCLSPAQHRDAAMAGGLGGKDSRMDQLQPQRQGTSRQAGISAAPFKSLLQTLALCQERVWLAVSDLHEYSLQKRCS